MSSAAQDDSVFDHDHDHDLDDDDSQSQDDDEDDLENDDVLAAEEDEDDLNFITPPTSFPSVVTPALPSASLVTVAAAPYGADPHNITAEMSTAVLPDPKRQRTMAPEAMMIVPLDERKPQPLDKSRQLFQRLWTDEDEIGLLQGFLEYTAQRGGSHHDTALFYDQIKSKLQLDFNKSQLVEKLRRLKKKYRNVLAKIESGKDFSFKSPHDQITFQISRKIWSATGKLAGVEDGNLDEEEGNPNLNNNPSNNGGEIKMEYQRSTPTPRKRSRPRSLASPLILSRCGGGVSVDGGNHGGKVDDKPVINHGVASNNGVNNNTGSNVNVGSLIEETVKSCLSPLFKELLRNNASMVSGGGIGSLAMNTMPLNFGGVEMMADAKWRKQHILELEAYSKRLELVQEQIRSQLKDLQSMGGR
ncbi:Probable transcription factor At5g28040 [Linum perenne]